MSNRRAQARFVALRCIAAALALSACRDTTAVEDIAGLGQLTADSRSLAAERVAAAKVASALAAAMDDADARRLLFDALASAKGGEHKVHLNSFLRGRGRRLLDVAEQRAGPRGADVVAAIREMRDFELYMPVSAHRAKWTSSETPLVAMLLDDADPIHAYDGRGVTQVLPKDHPPSRPVIAVVPMETDVRPRAGDDQGSGSASDCEGRPSETLERAWMRCHSRQTHPPPRANSVAALDGLYLHYLELYKDDWEPWIRGKPEYEIHTRHPSSQGAVGVSRQCTGERATGAGQPGIPSSAYNWDMNGQSWAGTAKLLSGPQLDVANATAFTLELWEDDLDACVLRASGLEAGALSLTLGGWVVLVAAVQTQDLPLGIIGAAIFITGVVGLVSSGDDFVGALVVPQGAYPPTYNTNMVIVQPGGLVGRARVQVHDATPPVPGPTASVHISVPGASSVPTGAMSYYVAWALDANGLAAPDRPASWSSSNPGVASVDADGWVSGNSEGSALITATIDGVSNSVSVNVIPYGPGVSVLVSPYELNLSSGQQQSLTARVFDANGFEVPTSPGSVQWQSGDDGACSVDWQGVVTAHGAPYWTTVTATVQGLTSDAVPCSVDGGGAFSRSGAPSKKPRGQ